MCFGKTAEAVTLACLSLHKRSTLWRGATGELADGPIPGISESHFSRGDQMKRSTLTTATLLVLSVFVLGSRAHAHDFTWDNLAFASIKLDKNFDIDANIEWYMEEYRTATWNLCRNDEFLMHEKKIETRKILG